MEKNNTFAEESILVSDSLGRKWLLEVALKAMNQNLRRRLGLDFGLGSAQASFELYCKKHFIEHGKHFDPGHFRSANVHSAIHLQQAAKQIVYVKKVAPLAPVFVGDNPGQSMNQTSQRMNAIKPNVNNLELQALRGMKLLMEKANHHYKVVESIGLRSMTKVDFESILEDERANNGVRAVLALGQYFIESEIVKGKEKLVVAKWLSECAQHEFERLLSGINQSIDVRLGVKVQHNGLDWAHARLHLEDDLRWLALSGTSVDFNVIIGMMLGFIAGKGIPTNKAALECATLLFPLDRVDISSVALVLACHQNATKD